MLREIVKNITSPLQDSWGMKPKVTYLEPKDYYGVFYSPKIDKFYWTSEDDSTLYEVEPIAVIVPDKNGNYPVSDDDIDNLMDCDFCGEADDMSCYVYFKYVD